jgi:hypothetical protein
VGGGELHSESPEVLRDAPDTRTGAAPLIELDAGGFEILR